MNDGGYRGFSPHGRSTWAGRHPRDHLLVFLFSRQLYNNKLTKVAKIHRLRQVQIYREAVSDIPSPLERTAPVPLSRHGIIACNLSCEESVIVKITNRPANGIASRPRATAITRGINPRRPDSLNAFSSPCLALPQTQQTNTTR